MKVKEFIMELQNKYNPDDELYFTTSANDTEFVFDNVEIHPKDCDETDVYLTFESNHRKEFEEMVAEELKREVKTALDCVISKYL